MSGFRHQEELQHTLIEMSGIKIYIKPDELKQQIIDARAGNLDGLLDTTTKICHGLYKRFHLGLELEDFTQECLMFVCTNLDKFDIDKSIFNYLTTCCFNAARQIIRKKTHHQKLLSEFGKTIKEYY